MSEFRFDIKNALEQMVRVSEKFEKASQLYADTAGKKMVAHAKKNATWTDRTSLSRNTIDNAVEKDYGQINIVLRGNTEQFKYLELSNAKKFAILWPTITKYKGEIVQGWGTFLNKVR